MKETILDQIFKIFEREISFVLGYSDVLLLEYHSPKPSHLVQNDNFPTLSLF